MERHVLWHRVARDLLGLRRTARPPLPDYVTPVGIWDPRTVRAMQRRLTEVSGRHWLDALTARLHVSEFVIYGVFAESTGAPPIDPAVMPGMLFGSEDDIAVGLVLSPPPQALSARARATATADAAMRRGQGMRSSGFGSIDVGRSTSRCRAVPGSLL